LWPLDRRIIGLFWDGHPCRVDRGGWSFRKEIIRRYGRCKRLYCRGSCRDRGGAKRADYLGKLRKQKGRAGAGIGALFSPSIVSLSPKKDGSCRDS
jgi:hypothetical protein